MTSVANPSTLDRYASEFLTRVSNYPGAPWELAYKAESRCRLEFWPAERRKHEAFHAANPDASSYRPEMPWESVIKASATAAEYWGPSYNEPAFEAKMAARA
eukprot:4678262-Amphidinium_carterae.1